MKQFQRTFSGIGRKSQIRYCVVRCTESSSNGIYDPFFELYVKAVCMKPAYGPNGHPECVSNMIIPPMDVQMEIVDAIQLLGIVEDINPIKGLLVRLMMMNNMKGVQAAMDALSDHYEALERLQRLSESTST